MRSLEWTWRFTNLKRHCFYQKPPGPPLLLISASFCNKISLQSLNNSFSSPVYNCSSYTESGIGLRPPSALPDGGKFDEDDMGADGSKEEEEEEDEKQQLRSVATASTISVAEESNSATIISSCLVGLLTGVAVVLFNNAVHEIRDVSWDGIPYRGASWLREEPTQVIWKQVILVPACGGLIVSLLNLLRADPSLQSDQQDSSPPPSSAPTISLSLPNNVKAALRPFLKAVAACVTLGTGNSLGPEGPSVDIGTSIAKGVGTLFDKSPNRKLSLVAAGSAAGIASGFNAAVAGCFFAVESVLWPSPAESSVSLTNTTSMVILSAVIAAVVSEIGLGSEPAFKVPEYDFRSPSELPLYLLLGMLCGFVSLILSRCTSYMLVIVENLHSSIGIPRALFPVMGGLAVGLIALAYPEILYWGFENVDILLESRPFVKGLSADLLLQLVAVKIVATSLCRASGLVGGYYAPSLFIGAATGMAYGKFISLAVAQSNSLIHLSILEVASPQAYGLVGMAATLAGVCQVPLTAVLLLFELTQDYRIVLPLLGAVGLSSWITSGQTRRIDVKEIKKIKQNSSTTTPQPEMSSSSTMGASSSALAEKASYMSNLCEVESSLCINDSDIEAKELEKRIFVSEAMRTRYVTVLMSSTLNDTVSLMLTEKQSCAMIVNDHNILIGLLTLGGIEEFSKIVKARSKRTKELLVSEMCTLDEEICRVPWTATPGMDLLSVQIIMNKHGVSQVPVIEDVEDHRGHLVGLLDAECIDLTCRALATREFLS
ncbi:chloride channel protein CLC-e isoform X1 [Juglans microcarpa x Juglans regia]|uniref:chloride channel protein CLC-e isoform X1 n=2 Tax=Juglans microcarpa x Juglans regia TaxID=2249226 RepID=UPI001B7E07BF|nr:chloride channel protein CLC-e isoform X1 [Juglans microcarpa x Juglans regia]